MVLVLLVLDLNTASDPVFETFVLGAYTEPMIANHFNLLLFLFGNQVLYTFNLFLSGFTLPSTPS